MPVLAGIHRLRASHLGVSRFGQSGDLEQVYAYHGINADGIVSRWPGRTEVAPQDIAVITYIE